MKKLNTGFTLMEVLMALAIVGIVAAVVAPRLVNNLHESYTGAVLAKVVRQLENGCQKIIAEANANSADGSTIETLDAIKVGDITHIDVDGVSDSDPLDENLAQVGYTFMDLEPLDLTAAEKTSIHLNAHQYDGTKINAADMLLLAVTIKFKCKKLPAEVYMLSTHLIDSDAESDYEKNVSYVFIDTDGYQNGSNAFGKDIFFFNITNSGKLVPYGSTEDDSYKEKCADSGITDGKTCTARVVADGWKITYR